VERLLDEPLAAVLSALHLDIVFEKSVQRDHEALMLRRHADSTYAVCLADLAAEICMAPNYAADDNDFLLCGRLTQKGLIEILDWTTREAAVVRFAALLHDDESGVYKGLSQAIGAGPRPRLV